MTAAAPPKSGLRELAARITNVLADLLAGRLEPMDVPDRLRRIADWVEAGRVDEVAARSAREAAAEASVQAMAHEVYAYWLRATKRSPTSTKFTAERRRHVTARLRDGYSVEKIRRAIDVCAASPFHQGDNDRNTRYDDLINICRNATRLEQLIEQGTGLGSTEQLALAPVGGRDEELERLRQDAAKALREGRHADYRAINDRTRALRATT
jgi:hypothetical protein